jgi:DNA-directed RNA polymerase subunit omega
MIFPLEKLIRFSGNIYEITSACNRRCFQMSMVHDPLIEAHDGKVVSCAAEQIFKHHVDYRIVEPE